MPDAAIPIRPATPDDQAWILPLAPRLHEFGPPPWRARPVMDRAVTESIERALVATPEGSAVLVAERAPGHPLGFVHLETAADFFTHEPHGHVSDLVVAPAGEGQGVGRALMAAAEEWSRSRGHRFLTLNVFGDNTRARLLYERLGYRPDTTKMVKLLG
jgi:ribosomal protein S18 acetylase RimI-like enzyme